jgi:hypothetical protein
MLQLMNDAVRIYERVLLPNVRWAFEMLLFCVTWSWIRSHLLHALENSRNRNVLGVVGVLDLCQGFWTCADTGLLIANSEIAIRP